MKNLGNIPAEIHMMATALRCGIIADIMSGLTNPLLPPALLTMMKKSTALKELLSACNKNGTSAYDDGTDDTGLQECVQPISREVTVPTVLLDAFSGAGRGNKRKTPGDAQEALGQLKLDKDFSVHDEFTIPTYNKTSRIYPGAFFGVLSGELRQYARVIQCMSYKNEKFVRLQLYDKKLKLPLRSNVHEKVRELGLPFLTPSTPEQYTIRSAAEMNNPLHVLHACPRRSCTTRFAYGIQGGSGSDHNQVLQFVLNIYHLGSVNF